MQWLFRASCPHNNYSFSTKIWTENNNNNNLQGRKFAGLSWWRLLFCAVLWLYRVWFCANWLTERHTLPQCQHRMMKFVYIAALAETTTVGHFHEGKIFWSAWMDGRTAAGNSICVVIEISKIEKCLLNKLSRIWIVFICCEFMQWYSLRYENTWC